MAPTKKLKLPRERQYIRKFQSAWTGKYGVLEMDGKAVCSLCSGTVVLRTFSVKRHFETNHEYLMKLPETERNELLKNSVDNFLQNQHVLSTPKMMPMSTTSSPQSRCLTMATFRLALFLAKHGKSLSEAEFIKEAMIECAEALFQGEDQIIQKIHSVPCSRNTIKDRILQLHADINEQLTEDLLNAQSYSLHLYDSNDRFVFIIRYPAGEIIREELLTLSSFSNIQELIDLVLKTFSDHNIDCSKVVSITTDRTEELIPILSKLIPHSFIYFSHGSPSPWPDLTDTIRVVSKIVNYLLSSRSIRFKSLLDEVDAQYGGPMTLTVKGLILSQFVADLDEIRSFLNEKGQIYLEMNDLTWLTKLMFFADFIQHLNKLNRILQGKRLLIDSMLDAIKTFAKKLKVFRKDLQSHNLQYFPFLKSFYESSSIFTNKEYMCNEFTQRIADYEEGFIKRYQYLLGFEEFFQMIRNIHRIQFDEMNRELIDFLSIGDNFEMELIELQENRIWREKFIDMNEQIEQIERERYDNRDYSNVENLVLATWHSLPDSFSSLKRLALALMSVFGSAHTAETFSTKGAFKSTRNRLSEETYSACVALNNTGYSPRIEALAMRIQQQPSH